MTKRVSLKGRGADLFFSELDPAPAAALPPAEPENPPAKTPEDASLAPEPAAPARPRTRRPRAAAAAETPPSAVDADDALDAIRRAVRVPGREVSFVRVSPEEKERLLETTYHYRRKGRRVTETEIQRIALNYLLGDFERHGDDSILARVLARPIDS